MAAEDTEANADGEHEDLGSKRYQQARTVPRYALVRPVEVTDANTGEHEYGQLAEISRKGCFIDVAKTLLVGTPVYIEIAIDPGSFKTNGFVIYTKAGNGMGIAFKDTLPEELTVLDSWLGANVSRCFFHPGQS